MNKSIALLISVLAASSAYAQAYNPTRDIGYLDDALVTGPDGKKMKWAGTVEDLHRTWCEDGSKKLATAKSIEEAPYRKVLKADKLTMALQTRSFYIRAEP